MKARTLLPAFALLSLLLIGAGERLLAQERTTVQGRITNRGDGNSPLKDVFVYAYNTVAEGRDAYDQLVECRRNNGFFEPGLVIQAYPENDGSYEISVPPTGAILFYCELTDPVLESVAYRKEINVSFDLNIILKESKVTAGGSVLPRIDPPEIFGNNVSCGYDYTLPEDGLRTDVRTVAQSYLMDGVSLDTVSFRKPVVMDGEMYHRTQLRRMGFEASNDPLMEYAAENPVLGDSTKNISVHDTLYLANPDHLYFCWMKMWMEDYTHVFRRDSVLLFNTGRLRRPMRFLQYNFENFALNPADYRKKPKREKREGTGEISLTFLTGKAVPDPGNPENAVNMEALEREISAVVHSEGSTLKEFHIRGTASPEGKYASNLKLAGERMGFALNHIRGIVPESLQRRVYWTKSAEVASWNSVADILEQEGCPKEASVIRKIVRDGKSPDAQWARISRLSFYKSKVEPCLARLRSVKYTYVCEVLRELTPVEVMDR